VFRIFQRLQIIIARRRIFSSLSTELILKKASAKPSAVPAELLTAEMKFRVSQQMVAL
jgi:hypothetical protein